MTDDASGAEYAAYALEFPENAKNLLWVKSALHYQLSKNLAEVKS